MDAWHGEDMDSSRDEGVDVPAYAAGGRVERTGIALVHEGEYIVPQAGSEAIVAPDSWGNDGVVNYYFPVQVEVVGCLSDVEVRRVADHIFAELDRELASRI
jgi:hypothetical protein